MVEGLVFAHRAVHLLEQARILDRIRQLIGHRLEYGDVLLGKRPPQLRLNRHSADHPVATDQRQGHLRFRLRQ